MVEEDTIKYYKCKNYIEFNLLKKQIINKNICLYNIIDRRIR